MTDTRTSLAVGDTRTLDVPPFSLEALVAFANASGDHNPIHVDGAAARAAGHDDALVHGMLSMAHASRLLTSWFEQDRLRTLSVRFIAVVPVGSGLRLEGVVDSIIESDDGPLAHITLRAQRDDGTCTLRGAATASVDPAPIDATKGGGDD